MSEYILKVDDFAIDRKKLQNTIDDLLSRPGARDFLSKEKGKQEILVTDNI